MPNILCIDDDVDICHLLKRFLTKNGFNVETAFTGLSGLQVLKNNHFDIVLCDFRLPDKDGYEMIKEIKSLKPFVPVILITAYSDVKTAVKAIQLGAFEYVSKPIHPEEILMNIKAALQKTENSKQDSLGSNETEPVYKAQHKEQYKYIVGESQQSKHIQKLIELVAPTDMTVLLLGESGTGKEVVANTIHALSARKNKPFVAVDCGSLPPELAGSELFGHKKGAFTGALNDKKGHFELANGGTLFLDEIGNLTYENQIKLLRALQERKVRALGDVRDIDVDIRIIVATNENLKIAVEEGSFRVDIFHRLNEFSIKLPALREKKEDILVYAKHFLTVANEELNKSIVGFSDDVIQKFQNYYWPGNLRELKNVIKRATLFSNDNMIKTSELPLEILHPQITQQDLNGVNGDDVVDLKTASERAEKKAILNALIKTNYNKSKTAELLNVDRKTLYNKMNALGIEL
jgi:two-component system response regulator HydG